MNIFRISAAALAVCLLGQAALAQSSVADKTRAELALEKASSQMNENREKRAEADAACAGGDADACFELGDLERRGAGGLQNYGAAAKAYRKACNANHAEACSALAYLANGGKGMGQDLGKARSLYKKSCDLGDVSGCAGYGNMLFTGQGGRKNVPEGTRVLRDACNRDYQWACDRARQLGAYDPEDDTWQRLKDVGSRF